MRAWHPRHLITLVAAAILTACGGGGSSSPTTHAPLPQVVSDTNPVGDRIDLRSRNYFPAAANDNWIYDHIQGDVTTRSGATTLVRNVDADTYTLSETVVGETASTETYRRTSAGLVATDITDGAVPAAARTLIGEILMYPEPFFPAGTTRRIVRQGDWGADEDGDGINESFRLEITQQLVGFESISLPRGDTETVHFRTVTALTLSPSSLASTPHTITGTEETWWAPGVGLVQADRSAVDSSNATVVAPYRLKIVAGSVGNVSVAAPPPYIGSVEAHLPNYDLTSWTPPPTDSVTFLPDPTVTVKTLSLPHNALVFDATRNRYYASIPGSLAGIGTSIATIDAATGAIGYSRGMGAEPFAMAVSPDGNALYVALTGSGEIVKLSLPGMAEQYRVRLPIGPYFNSQLQARSIAVSPTEPDVLAVSTYDPWASGINRQVILIRAGVIQAQTVGGASSPIFIGPIAFDGSGTTVYGYDSYSSAAALYALSVRQDGLALVGQSSIQMGFAVRDVDWISRGVVVNSGVYRSSDLALLGAVSSGNCRAHSVANRLICLTPDGGGIDVIDATSFATLATQSLGSMGTSAASAVVPGAAGQVVIRFGSSSPTQPATDIWLLKSAKLQ